MIRMEVEKPEGVTIRIVNQGVGIIKKPDGTIRRLLTNNTLAERADYIPIFSMLAEYQDPSVSVENRGTAQINGRTAQIVALRPLPTPSISQSLLDQTVTKTEFYIDQVNGTILKIASTNFAENDTNSGQRVEVYLSDYRSVNGSLVPFHQTEYYGGKPGSDLILDSVTFNIGLQVSEFVLPD